MKQFLAKEIKTLQEENNILSDQLKITPKEETDIDYAKEEGKKKELKAQLNSQLKR